MSWTAGEVIHNESNACELVGTQHDTLISTSFYMCPPSPPPLRLASSSSSSSFIYPRTTSWALKVDLGKESKLKVRHRLCGQLWTSQQMTKKQSVRLNRRGVAGNTIFEGAG